MEEEGIYCSIRSHTFPHLQALAIAELNELERILDIPSSFHFDNPLVGEDDVSLFSASRTTSMETLSKGLSRAASTESLSIYDWVHNGSVENLSKGMSRTASIETLTKGMSRIPSTETLSEGTVQARSTESLQTCQGVSRSPSTETLNKDSVQARSTENLRKKKRPRSSIENVSKAGNQGNQTLRSLSMSLPNLSCIGEPEVSDDQDPKVEAVPDAVILKQIEVKFEQLSTMLGKFDKLEQAKKIAMEQASQALRKHTAEQIEQLKKQEAKLLKDLQTRHAKDIKTIKETHAEFQESLDVLKDTLASVYTGLSRRQFSADYRDSGYDGSDTESDPYTTIPADAVEVAQNRQRITQQVSVRLDDMLNQIPNIMWKQRTVAQFVSGSNVPRLGAFKECFMSHDYKKVTKLKAYSFSEEKPRPSISTMRRRAKSAMSLYNDGEELCISPVTTTPEPLSQPRLLFHVSQKGSYPGGIHNPVDTTFLPNGNVVVAEYGNGRLQEFDATGKSLTLFTTKSPMLPTTKPSKFQPQGITMSREGYVVATDGAEKNIKIFTRGGELVCKFGTGFFKDPSAIVEAGRDTYLVIDNAGPWQHCVFSFNAMSGQKTRIGYDKNGVNVISQPEYICIDKTTGNILISDSLVHCVWVFNAEFELLFRFGKDNENPEHDLSHPKGISFDSEGNILVADCANHRIAKYSSNGSYVTSILDHTHGLNYPQVVLMSKERKLAVVANSEVIVFET